MRTATRRLALWRRPAAAFDPLSLGFDVAANAARGVFTDAAGATPASAEGAAVNGWSNAGLLGGLLAKASDVSGPRLRLNAGKPYLEFGPSGGTGYRLGIASGQASLGDLTIHMVIRHDFTGHSGNAGNSGGALHRYAWSTAGVASGDNGQESAYVVGQVTGIGVENNDSHTPPNLSFLPVTDGLWHVLSWRRQSKVWTVWVDGQNVLTMTGTTNPTAGQFNVGGATFGSALSGGVAAALYAPRAHADAQVAQVAAYYLANHPLLARPAKALCWCGDSTSTPQNAYATAATSGDWLMPRGMVFQSGSYCQANAGLGSFWSTAKGGATTAQQRALAPVMAAWLNRATSKKALVIYSGTNDIRAGGAGLTPAQSYAQILGLQSDVAALVPGLVTVVGTICDGDPAFYAGFTSLRNTLNGLIVGGAAANGYTAARIDLDAVGLDGAYSTHPEWFVANDGLHRIAPGMDREALVFGPAIAGVL